MLLANYNQFQVDFSSKGIEYAAEHTLALGFNAVEFLTGYPTGLPAFTDLKAAERTAEVLKRYGLPTACFSVGASLYGPNIKETEEAFCRYAEIAAILGSPYLHHTLYLPLSLPANAPAYTSVLAATIDAVEHIAARAAAVGVTCLYEPQGMYFNGIGGLEGLLSAMKCRAENIGVCGDVGNPLFVDADPAALFAHFATDIRHVHVKDYFVRTERPDDPEYKPTRGGRYVKQCTFGEGDVALSSCFQALHTAGYNGAYAFELSGTDDELRRAIEVFRSLHTEAFSH